VSNDYLTFLIIFLAVVCGWSVGIWQGRNRSNTTSQSYTNQECYELPYYFSNDVPDYALDAFISALDVDSNTLETHLTLGAIHRRRGELDRAIRLHENLLKRDGLNHNQISLAKFELALDYVKAGLNDRAEDFLQELIETSQSHKVSALYLLIELYQTEKEWRQASQAALALRGYLDKEGQERLSHQTAHFYCEEAQNYINEKDFLGARNAIKQAESCSSVSNRPLILKAKLYLKLGFPEKSYQLLEPLIVESEELQERTVNLMASVCEALNKPERYLSLLKKAYLRQPSCYTLVLLIHELSKLGKSDQLLDIIEDRLPEDISSMPIRLFSEFDNQLLNQLGVSLINSLTNNAATESLYQCHDCGFETQDHYWQCPGCHHWETLRTRNKLQV